MSLDTGFSPDLFLFVFKRVLRSPIRWFLKGLGVFVLRRRPDVFFIGGVLAVANQELETYQCLAVFKKPTPLYERSVGGRILLDWRAILSRLRELRKKEAVAAVTAFAAAAAAGAGAGALLLLLPMSSPLDQPNSLCPARRNVVYICYIFL